MVKPFLLSFLRRGKKRADQHAMLVGFLALLCPVKEVHMMLKNIKKHEIRTQQSAARNGFYSRSFRGE